MKKALKRLLKKALWSASPQIARNWFGPYKQEFSIGIYVGESPLFLSPVAGAVNPVLTYESITDVPAGSVSDPFMCKFRGIWCMFFEVYNRLTGKGEIALATSSNALDWKYECIVLSEPYHISYPYVFEWLGEHYMVPESSRGSGVSLYRAAEFPFCWESVGPLFKGARYADTSVFLFRDLWWAITDGGESPLSPCLRLFFADKLEGPWSEHPKSPVTDDIHISRPGGRIVIMNDMPIRFAQDVTPINGRHLSAFWITALTCVHYEEIPARSGPVLEAGSELWNCDGMHHMDAHQLSDGTWIACVDGFRMHVHYTRKYLLASRLTPRI